MLSWRVGLRSNNKTTDSKSEEAIMPERRIKIPYPLPNSPPRDGWEVQVRESTEKWSEVTLEDGTVLRIKLTVLAAVRIEGEYDPEGNPAYSLKMNPMVTTVNSDPRLRRPGNAPGVH
jgi:hypothetical protein